MRRLNKISAFRRNVRGISAVEYAILIGVVGVALVAALGGVGDGIGGYVTSQITALTDATTAAQAPAPAPNNP